MIQLDDSNLGLLAHKLEQKRQQLVDTAAVQGMENEETLSISQELDRLILAYQKSKGD
ncbi:hypothetical protein GCM10028778_27250 [Barrientosiimonas marina]|uniref:Spo0E family sporulation regulatory protein-aspartic acid phosphatase n=1 Tax=Lentibacillus kimchii TaxID=1542911 RepID=A0ABW2UUF8_9BACI